MKNIMPPIDTPDKSFHDGNPATGEQGTIVSALWLNNVQRGVISTQQEMASVLSQAGIDIDEAKQNQLLTAIQELISTGNDGYLKAARYLGEIKALGAGAVAQAITNLGLTDTATAAAGAMQKNQNLNDVANKAVALTNLGALPANGTAAAATKLATARLIAGKSFNGTADISIGASDVGALPLTGGALSGPLTVNGTHDAPLGANGFRSCILTPGNGGFTNPAGVGIGLHSNGTIYLWNDASSGYAMSVSSTGIGTSRPLSVGGTVTPTDYSNFDGRYSKFGVSQAWTDVLSGRVSGTWYTNNTGKPIMISVTTDYGPNAALNCQTGSAGTIAYPRGGGSEYIQHNATFIVVPGDTYRVVAAGTIGIWKELR